MPSRLMHIEIQEGMNNAEGEVIQTPQARLSIRVIPQNKAAADLGPLLVTVQANEIPERVGLPDSTRQALFEKVVAALKTSL